MAMICLVYSEVRAFAMKNCICSCPLSFKDRETRTILADLTITVHIGCAVITEKIVDLVESDFGALQKGVDRSFARSTDSRMKAFSALFCSIDHGLSNFNFILCITIFWNKVQKHSQLAR